MIGADLHEMGSAFNPARCYLLPMRYPDGAHRLSPDRLIEI
jgi:hypothetical protein